MKSLWRTPTIWKRASNHDRGRQACKRQHPLPCSRRLYRRGQGRHGLTVRLLPQSSSPQWAAAFSVRSLYTGVLLHEPENSPTLLRTQQNKGVFFVCSLSGMVIPRAFLCIDCKHDHQRAEGISWVGNLNGVCIGPIPKLLGDMRTVCLLGARMS